MSARLVCCRFDVLDELLRAGDASIAKAFKVSELGQIARIEDRTRRALDAKWTARANEASAAARGKVSAGKPLAEAFDAVDAEMKQWADDVETGYKQNLSDVYRLARTAGWKRATGKLNTLSYQVRPVEKASKGPSLEGGLDLVDLKALESLHKQEMMWIGNTYKGVAPTIRNAVEDKMLQGLSKEAAGKMVGDAVRDRLTDWRIPKGYNGTAKSYFEGVAANAVTNARVQGQLRSFGRLGVTTYTIVNPMDARTSPICEELNGTTFKVADAESQLAKLGKAQTPEQYQKIKPWLSEDKILKLAAKGAGALGKAGQLFPPFHFRCRSTVDIAEESLSFAELED